MGHYSDQYDEEHERSEREVMGQRASRLQSLREIRRTVGFGRSDRYLRGVDLMVCERLEEAMVLLELQCDRDRRV